MVWLGKWGVGWSGSGFELSVGRDGVGVRSAFRVVRVGYGMVWFGVWGRWVGVFVRGMCVVE